MSRFSYYHAGGPGQLPPDGIFDLISVTEQSTAIDPATGIRYSPRANYAYRALSRPTTTTTATRTTGAPRRRT